jgi:hypothetical protein
MAERKDAPKVEITEGLQPRAEVVSTYVRPEEPQKSPLWDVARALADLNPKIASMFDGMAAKQEADNKLKGEAAFWLGNSEGAATATQQYGESGGQTGIPAFASPGFSQGFGKAQGTSLMMDFEAQVAQEYTQHPTLKQSDDPRVFDSWFRETAKKYLAPHANNPNVLRGILPHLNSISQRQQAQWLKDRDERLRGTSEDAHGRLAGRLIDASIQDGRERPDGPDLTTVSQQMQAVYDNATKSGLERSRAIKAVTDAILLKAVEHKDTRLLALLDTVKDATGIPLSDTEYGKGKKVAVARSIQGTIHQDQQQEAARQRARDEAEKKAMTAEFYQNLRKDPRHQPSEEWLKKMERVAPDFSKGIGAAREALLNGNTAENDNDLLVVQTEILNGGGLDAITKGRNAGILRKPETISKMLALEEKVREQASKGAPILQHPQIKFLEKQITLLDKPSPTSPMGVFGEPGLSNGALDALKFAKERAMEWAIANPTADPVAREKFLQSLTEQTLQHFAGPNQGLGAPGEMGSKFVQPGTPAPAPAPSPITGPQPAPAPAPTPQPGAPTVPRSSAPGLQPQAPQHWADRFVTTPQPPAIKDAGFPKEVEARIRSIAKKEGVDPQVIVNRMHAQALRDKAEAEKQKNPGAGQQAPGGQGQPGNPASPPPEAAPLGTAPPGLSDGMMTPQSFRGPLPPETLEVIKASLQNAEVDVPGVGKVNLGSYVTPQMVDQIAQTLMPADGAGSMPNEAPQPQPVPTAGNLSPEPEPAEGAGSMPNEVPRAPLPVPSAGIISTEVPAPKPVATAGRQAPSKLSPKAEARLIKQIDDAMAAGHAMTTDEPVGDNARAARVARSAVGPVVSKVAREMGMDAKTLATLVGIESGGNPNAKTGSYRGLLQLSADEFRRYGEGGNIMDPEANLRAGVRSLQDKGARFAREFGRKPSATELYLMHQQGEAGLRAHLRNPDAPAWKNMLSTGEGRRKGAGWARKAIWGNVPSDVRSRYGSVDNLTSRQFVSLWQQKVAGKPSRGRMAEGDVEVSSSSRRPDPSNPTREGRIEAGAGRDGGGGRGEARFVENLKDWWRKSKGKEPTDADLVPAAKARAGQISRDQTQHRKQFPDDPYGPAEELRQIREFLKKVGR